MELSAEVSQKIEVIERLAPVKLLITHVLQKTPPVKRYLCERSFKLETGVPCPALCRAEACAIRSGVGKSSIYDVRLGNAKNQFVGTDSRGSAGLRYLPFIGDGVELTAAPLTLTTVRTGSVPFGAKVL